jgi:hypothetical protein
MKIFLREIEETYGGGGRLVGPVARVGPENGVRSDGHPTLSITETIKRLYMIISFVNKGTKA